MSCLKKSFGRSPNCSIFPPDWLSLLQIGELFRYGRALLQSTGARLECWEEDGLHFIGVRPSCKSKEVGDE